MQIGYERFWELLGRWRRFVLCCTKQFAGFAVVQNNLFDETVSLKRFVRIVRHNLAYDSLRTPIWRFHKPEGEIKRNRRGWGSLLSNKMACGKAAVLPLQRKDGHP